MNIQISLIAIKAVQKQILTKKILLKLCLNYELPVTVHIFYWIIMDVSLIVLTYSHSCQIKKIQIANIVIF